MNRELAEWLKIMVIPESSECDIVHAKPGYDWSQHEGGELYGIILESNSKSDIEEAYRVLRPGGHLFLVSPDQEPTGHTGACISEDTGFEVRDSILIVDEPGNFVYSGKTSTREREAGCDSIEEKDFGMSGGANGAIDSGEDYESAQSIGLNRVSKRRNIHPTVKPKAVMEFLLSGVETDKGPVVDPFMGSGTTGIACLKVGHDFVGIEREEEYTRIADARIRHWVMVEESWVPRRIESDVAPEVKQETKVTSFLDLLGI